MDLFDFLKNEYERKRDYYRNLYQDLQENITDYSNGIAEINSMLSSYKGKMPHSSSGSIPSNEFVPKREQLDEKLTKYISAAKEKQSSLIAAKQAAYNRYIYYRDQANAKAKEGK
ncbi:chorismate synthase [Bacillus sp. GB_SG_008]|uniref:chorismate synthase n=1 Tax=Bacillus sp. GB_SG_008 TaxID=3454627 RepID=UPI003F84818B